MSSTSSPSSTSSNDTKMSPEKKVAHDHKNCLCNVILKYNNRVYTLSIFHLVMLAQEPTVKKTLGLNNEKYAGMLNHLATPGSELSIFDSTKRYIVNYNIPQEKPFAGFSTITHLAQTLLCDLNKKMYKTQYVRITIHANLSLVVPAIPALVVHTILALRMFINKSTSFTIMDESRNVILVFSLFINIESSQQLDHINFLITGIQLLAPGFYYLPIFDCFDTQRIIASMSADNKVIYVHSKSVMMFCSKFQEEMKKKHSNYAKFRAFLELMNIQRVINIPIPVKTPCTLIGSKPDSFSSPKPFLGNLKSPNSAFSKK